jgi:hypothetical protein
MRFKQYGTVGLRRRRLPAAERIGTAKGVVRPRPAGARPSAHPYYWAASILVGDPL